MRASDQGAPTGAAIGPQYEGAPTTPMEVPLVRTRLWLAIAAFLVLIPATYAATRTTSHPPSPPPQPAANTPGPTAAPGPYGAGSADALAAIVRWRATELWNGTIAFNAAVARNEAAARTAQAAALARRTRRAAKPPAHATGEPSRPTGHSETWWHGVAGCEQGGRNDPYFGYFSVMDGSAGGKSWADQLVIVNGIIARHGDGAWAASCVAAGYRASPGG